MRSMYVKQRPPAGGAAGADGGGGSSGGGRWALYDGRSLECTPAHESELPGPLGGKLLQVGCSILLLTIDSILRPAVL